MRLAGWLSVLTLALLADARHSRSQRRDAALRNSPTGNYAPLTGKCPASGVKIRHGQTIDPNESAYIARKTVTSLDVWTSYLHAVNLTGLVVSDFVPAPADAVAGQTVPNVGFAVSGGGIRALMVGASIMSGFDNRNELAVERKTGGVLQLAQYVAGLSGTSWLVGSYSLAGFPTFEKLRISIWELNEILFLPSTSDPTGSADAVISIQLKRFAGAPVSIVDAMGRLLSYHLVNDTRFVADVGRGPGSATLWSSIKDTVAFKKGTAPFPIISALGRAPHYINVTIESPQFEITPYHFGTNTPSSGGLYLPIEYLGTKFTNGTPSSASRCMTGFENAGFLMACSGNIIGVPAQLAIQEVNVTAITENEAINNVLSAIPDALVVNPFFGLGASTGFPPTNDPELALTDGGLGGEIIPFFPLIQPQRGLDVIVAVDATAELDLYPNGEDIHNTYLKSLLPGYDIPFPVIPPPWTFVAQKLNKRPVFFGSACYTQPNSLITPLIVYLPSYYIVYPTNTSTAKTAYKPVEQDGFFSNGYEIATPSGNKDWPACMACALVDSQQARNGAHRSAQCELCFEEYCWMGES